MTFINVLKRIEKSRAALGISPDERLIAACCTTPGHTAMVLTDRRLLFIKLSSIAYKPKELLVQWPRCEVAEITVEETRTAFPITIAFRDGATVHVEGVKGSDPRSVALGCDGWMASGAASATELLATG